MQIPVYIRTALDKLTTAGFSAYVVGGSVRDSVLGINPTDFDLATSAAPEQTKACFDGFRQFYAGVKHGTVSVIIDGNVVEITTFRIDGEYQDSRRPQNVTFTQDLQKDLARRDFTVNAMAFHPQVGILDFFGGVEDIKTKTIRCIGDSRVRFTEDALRILRALRFSSALGFDIEPSTQQGMRDCARLLLNISKERIVFEIKKIITGKNAKNVLEKHFHIIQTVAPEIERLKPELFENTSENMYVRLAFLMLYCENPNRLMRRLGFDNNTRETVRILLDWKAKELRPEPVFLKQQLRYVSLDDLCLAAKFKSGVDGADYSNVLALINQIIGQNQCFSLESLAIDGGDVMALGFSGKQVGAVLNGLLDMVICGQVENKKTALIKAVKSMDLPN